MEKKLMATRMRYLETVLKKLRAELSTEELINNPAVLQMFRSIELHLHMMEVAYVGTPRTR